MDYSMPSFTVHHQLPELTQTHVHWAGNASQPFHPLWSPAPPAFNLSQHQGLFYESILCIRWPKYWSFSISPSNEHSGLISFRINWFDLIVVQRTLKSLIQYHSSKVSILWHSAFFYGPTLTSLHAYWKNHIFARWTFVGKIKSQLFNMLSRLVISFLWRSKPLLRSWLQ